LTKCTFHITWHKPCMLVTLDVTNTQVSQVFKTIWSSPSNTHEMSHMNLNYLFFLIHERSFCFTASAFWPLIFSVYLKCRWFLVLFLTINLWSFQTLLYTATENWNFHECRPSPFLAFIWVLKYVLQDSNRGSFVSVKFIYHRTKDFKVFCITHSGIQPGSPPCNYSSWREWCVWSIFLNSSLLAGDFTKIFFPLATNLSTLG
jgi:hypothetical protein